MSLDQAFIQSTSAAEPGLQARHTSVIALVIIAKKMQQSVERQHPQLGLERVSRLEGLPARDACRNHDISEVTGVLAGKRQDVRRMVFAPVTTIDRTNTGVGDNRDGNRTPRAGRGYQRQPATQSGRANARIIDHLDRQVRPT